LVVTAASSNPGLVPVSSVFLESFGASRYVLACPEPNHSGRATITLTVRDGGGLTAQTQFELVVCPGGPEIVVHPADQVAEPGMTVQLSVQATGTNLTYQWFMGANPLPGQTSTILVITNVGPTDAGEYHVEVADGLCQTVSRTAVLRIVPTLNVELYAVVSVEGMIGHSYRLECKERVDGTETWKALAVLTLERSPELFIDLSSPRTTNRFYRAVAAPNP
jgi:hypothetical protein